jgi:hypothetical protein
MSIADFAFGFNFSGEKSRAQRFMWGNQITNVLFGNLRKSFLISFVIAFLDFKNKVDKFGFKEKISEAFTTDKTDLILRPKLLGPLDQWY